MAFVLRKLFHSRYCRKDVGGILASYSHVQNLNVNPVIVSISKGTIIDLFPKAFGSYTGNVSSEASFRKFDRFRDIYIPPMRKVENIYPGEIVNIFLKITGMYIKLSDQVYFKSELNKIVRNPNFKRFQKILEIKLPQMPPEALILLYDIIKFPELASKGLVNSICSVILENMKNFTPIEKIQIYAKVLNHYSVHNESNNIKNVCETYIEKYLETDLCKTKDFRGLLQLLDIQTLPNTVLKLISGSLIELACSRHCIRQQQHLLIEKLISMELELDLVSKSKLKLLVEECLLKFNTGFLGARITTCYRKLCEQDDYFYSKDTMELIKRVFTPKMYQGKFLCTIMLNICKMGHLPNNSVSAAVDTLLGSRSSEIDCSTMLTCAEVLARSSFQDTHKENFKNIIKFFESFNDFNLFSFHELCEYCEYITYLGCDTRTLCDIIFNKVTEEFEATLSGRNVLDLHHLAKVCLSNGYKVLSGEKLDKLLEAQYEENHGFLSENLKDYFGSEDFVLKNCTTSDKHYLHFVAIFGPDNKPIDLSAYNKERSVSREKFLNIEKIEKPDGHKMIAFQKFDDLQPIKFHDGPLISGKAKMYLKLFENLDCSIVLLPRKFFISTSEKKLEFLREQVENTLKSE